eukprot:1142073-Pelagomonas_calceolata.AAC.1
MQAGAHTQARACALEGGSMKSRRKRRVVRRARKGMAAVRRMALRGGAPRGSSDEESKEGSGSTKVGRD